MNCSFDWKQDRIGTENDGSQTMWGNDRKRILDRKKNQSQNHPFQHAHSSRLCQAMQANDE
jgi:hypothetical protein